ncbi:MAG: hypothetical protein ACP5M4_07845 [Acidobacteriaceae bacterium]
MSTSSVIPALTPTTRRIRAYFAPVNRTVGQPTVFDPSLSSGFQLDSPPAPWMDLGWVEGFVRKSESKYGALAAGSPANVQFQVRESLDATVSLEFTSWTKLTMALATGSQHMNVIAAATPASGSGNGSGSKGVAAVNLASTGSTASFLAMTSSDAATFAAGSLVTVDVDYTGQTGFVGSGVSAAYVSNATAVNSDGDYIRRVSFNVARVQAVSSTGLTLSQPLIAGSPTSGMRVQPILGFVDREGGSFFQEWSALFVVPGDQGDRVIFYYPRLQAIAGAEEIAIPLTTPVEPTAASTTLNPVNRFLSATAGVGPKKATSSQKSPAKAHVTKSSHKSGSTRKTDSERVSLSATFRALPVTDANDSERVVRFRTYIPTASALV